MNATISPLPIGQPTRLADVRRVEFGALRADLLSAVGAGERVLALFCRADAESGSELFAVRTDRPRRSLAAVRSPVGSRFPSLTPDCPQLHLFEREIFEQHGIAPEGHPWLKPVRTRRADATQFFSMAGAGIHEVAVGPVHAGIIEPGHFRFQCEGEIVHHLEIALGYQHRGVERALRGGPNARTVHYIETLSGDSTAAHAVAYAQLVESLAKIEAPARAQSLRGVALELERCANHTGDLGALAGDVGFLPSAAAFGRLRGEFLNLTALACGSRLGRGWIRPGGCAYDLDPSRIVTILDRIGPALRGVHAAFDLARNTSTVRARFEETGTLTPADCAMLGLVGPAARSCGIAQDVRAEFPSGIYARRGLPIATWPSGDVMSRARVRWLEVEHSVSFLQQTLESMSDGPARVETGPLVPDAVSVGLVEGWRGEVVHVATTDRSGRFADYKVVDPSCRNWAGLALAMRAQAISDFPLCNKSFNLSYCGHDL